MSQPNDDQTEHGANPPLESDSGPVSSAPEQLVVASDDPAGAHPPLPVLEYRTDDGVKLWTAGTLTYTIGGLALLFFWLLWGDFALSIRDRSVGPVVQLFLRREGVSNTLIAVLLSSLPPALGMFLGPIISYRSDRLRSRWGRRIPFLIIPTPIAAAAMVGIAFCPQIGDAIEHLLGGRYSNSHCTIAAFAFFWTIFEVAAIASASVFGGLINDVVPRPLLGRFFALFRAVSLADGMIFNYFLLQRAESHFFMLFLAIALVFGSGFLLMCLNVKEGSYPPPHALDSNQRERRGFFEAAKIYFSECYSHPHYLWCFAAITLGTITFLPINLFSIPFAKHMKIDLEQYGKFVTAGYFVSICLAYPIGSLVDRFHALRVGLVALSLYAISMAWAAWAIRDANTFCVALFLHTVLSGSCATATISLGLALLPRSKFSQFASAGGILTSLVTITVGPVIGSMLDWTNHNYRLTYVAGFLISCVAVLVLCVVYRNFLRLGGPKGYIAPGDSPTDIAVAPHPALRH